MIVAAAEDVACQIVEMTAAVVDIVVASPYDCSTHFHQFEGSCLAHEEACEASADAVTWESLKTIVSEPEILVQKKFEVEPESYFAEKKIWGVGAVVVRAASEHWMWQTADGAAAAAAAANAAAIASPLQSELHTLDAGCLMHDSVLEDEDEEDY